MVTVTTYSELEAYKRDVVPFLEQHEAANGLILGVLLAVNEPPLFMATVRKEKQIVAALLQTIPDQMIVSKTVGLTETDVIHMTKQVIEEYHTVPGLVGEASIVHTMASVIDPTRKRTELKMKQGVYELKSIQKPHRFIGVYRQVRESEQQLFQQWIQQFSIECHMPMSEEEAEKRIQLFLERGNLYALEVDGEVVSMCAWTRPTKHNVSISFVYTPSQHRKRGYASDIVAFVTAKKLQEGYETTSLYTDLLNPTSNKIYQEIGYNQVMESVLIYFHS